jgi:DNA-directed RNA polymerase subunit RPC12/RpoP
MSKLVNPIFLVIIVTLIVAAWQDWMNHTFNYQCGNCGEVFGLSLLGGMLSPHMRGRKLIRCPNCGKISWSTPVHK